MNPNQIAMPAVRSAASVLYSPAVTVERTIGLRNDPHRAAIIAQAREREQQLWQAAGQMAPFERRDFEQWIQSDSGQAFSQWVKRALVVAGALEIIETAWSENQLEETNEDDEDPLIRQLAEAAWWFDNHGMWLLGAAFVVAFVAFFAIGPATGPVVSALKTTAWTIAVILIAIHLTGRALPAVLRWRCRKLNRQIPTANTAQSSHIPLWGADSPVTSARILNHINWAILAQPDAEHLLNLQPPTCPYNGEEHSQLSAWQLQIAQTLVRTEQRAAKRANQPQTGTNGTRPGRHAPGAVG